MNDGPVAQDDTATVFLDTPVTIQATTVVSLIDGNTITAGATTLHLDRNQSGSIPQVDLG